MLRRILSLSALLAISTTTLAFADEGERLRLRVLTYNVWGIPVITPLRAERIARIAPAIARLNPDLVALEEVWIDEDADVLTEGLAKAGLPYVERYAPEWPNQNGLLIASRYPLHDFTFKRYTQGRHPHHLWHVDYLSAKGIARVKVDTPIGPIEFAATHLQAGYGTKDYVFVQMHQALQAAEELHDRSHPTILAGDINSRAEGLPARLLRARAGLTLADPKSGIDQILFRDGAFAGAEILSVSQVLTEPVDFGDASMPLSDHPGVLAELELTTCDGRCAPATLGDHLRQLEADVLPLVEQELSTRYFNMTRDMVLALALPLFGLLLIVWRRRSLGYPCLRVRTAALLLLLAAGWFAYLHTSFGPAHVAGLLDIRGRFAASAVDRTTSPSGVLSRSGS